MATLLLFLGQVEEWQSLGNFNVPQQTRRRAHEDESDESVPAEKRRDMDDDLSRGKHS